MKTKFPRRSVKNLVSRDTPARIEPRSEPHSMPEENPHAFEISRLWVAVNGSQSAHATAYPILARYGFMERTADGYKAIDPGAVVSRCRELIAQLEAKS